MRVLRAAGAVLGVVEARVVRLQLRARVQDLVGHVVKVPHLAREPRDLEKAWGMWHVACACMRHLHCVHVGCVHVAYVPVLVDALDDL